MWGGPHGQGACAHRHDRRTARVQKGRFVPSLHPVATPDLCFSASLSAFLQLIARQEDPDTLFFARRLSIEGDTELGLQVKNMFDAIDFDGMRERLQQRLRIGPFHNPVARH